MAVYKPTFCYPFLNSVDIRTAQYADSNLQPAQFLTCQIDTSNKKITGYKIRILSSDNTQVFPVMDEETISPITELQIPELGYDEDNPSINSGLNGTTLRIPFFQNQNQKILNSYNAVYYKPAYLADHIVSSSDVTGLTTSPDQLSNWNFDANNDLVYNWQGATQEDINANIILLDGEILLEGEIVLILGEKNSTDISGLYIVEGEQTETPSGVTITTKLHLMFAFDSTVQTTLIKGDALHNNTFIYAPNDTPKYVKITTGGEWETVTNLQVPDLDSSGSMYKWELTLYQGEPYRTVSSVQYNVSQIIYEDVDEEWLDMTLSSGKIMGSTPERIQIASSDDQDALIPNGTDADPLVLQGKYIELSSTLGTTPFSGGVRTYVKTYDSTYGHIYPAKDSLSASNIESTQYCQFFKYSSNPQEIKDTDIVNYCFTEPVELRKYALIMLETTTSWTSITTDAEFLAVSSNNRYIEIDIDDTDYGNLIKDGDLILLAGQGNDEAEQGFTTHAYENGVYQITQVSDTTTHTVRKCLIRVTGYDKWSDYIGKIIYCQNGTNGRGINMQSLASAGGTLWDINNPKSGTSNLYFDRERPVLLFQDKVKPKNSFNLYSETPYGGSTTITGAPTLDGMTILQGDRILYSCGTHGTITDVSNDEYTISIDTDAIEENDYVYILTGKKYGKLVLKYSNNIFDTSWDLHTAKILKNTTTKTFISPCLGLQNNMKLLLLNNKFITKTGGEKTKWIKINTFNDKIYYITHDALLAPLDSYKPVGSSDESIPWSYDIRYFFKTSDENPFYSYETPYITLKKNNELYSDLKMINTLYYYYVKTVPESISNLKFLSYNEQGDTQTFLTVNYQAQTNITGRSVKLEGLYNGLGESSWESYRWILYNDNWDIIQDTGKRYNKDMSVVFFGLTNDTLEDKIYYAALLVENNYGDVIVYIISLNVYPGSVSNFLYEGGEFNVSYDCSTQSNLIEFKEFENIENNNENIHLYSIYRREYDVLENPKTQYDCYYNSVDQQCYEDIEYSIAAPKRTSYLYVDQNTKSAYTYDPSNDIFISSQGFKIYKSEWQPVIINSKKQYFRDFNITNDKSYEYIIYLTDSQDASDYGLDTIQQCFANHDSQIWVADSWNPLDPLDNIQDTSKIGKMISGTIQTSVMLGSPTRPHWECWSIAELIPETLDFDAPLVKKQYKVDNNNIWLFKYSLESGSQTQNISKEEFTTLGRFSKFGYSRKNYDSGSISALIGSELVLSSQFKYIERLRSSRITPLSTNERVAMLNKWNDFCYSKNPKLLKDIKGRSWIVQVISNSTTGQDFVANVPETVSFEWRQIDTTNDIVIYGDYSNIDTKIKDSIGDPLWTSPYSKKY